MATTGEELKPKSTLKIQLTLADGSIVEAYPREYTITRRDAALPSNATITTIEFTDEWVVPAEAN
jgi:hypothetical protein